jgi:hypothetical protein
LSRIRARAGKGVNEPALDFRGGHYMSTVFSHQSVRLARGKHGDPSDGVCVMELASMLAGERFSDHPRAVCRLVGSVLRTCNDRFDDDTRQRLYRYASEAVGSAGGPEMLKQRLALCVAAVERHAIHDRLFRCGLRRRVAAPASTSDSDLDRFAAKVVGVLARGPRGTGEVLALVDQLLAVGPSKPTAAGTEDTATLTEPDAPRHAACRPR